jgi:amino acid transporter
MIDDLAGLGYRQELRRRLRQWHVLGLAMADVSPTMGVLLLSAGVFAIGGTFAIGSNLALGVVVILIALCLGELGAMYPIAGGMYSLVKQLLPAPAAWVTMFNFLLQGAIIPASIGIGIGQYLEALIPAITLPVAAVAVASILLAAAIAAVRVELGAWVTATMVVVELTVLTIVTVAAFLHPHQSLLAVTLRPVVLDGSTLRPVTVAVMLATLAPAFNVINGYDATLGFAEELVGGARAVARAVVAAAVLAAVLIIVPLTAALLAAPDLRVFFQSSAPVVYVVKSALGPNAVALVDLGVCVALFNAMLSLFMYFARVFYATGRDGVWWTGANRWLAALNRFRVPGGGVLVLAALAIVLVFASALNWLIIFAGTITSTVYFFVGIAALRSRFSQRDRPRPYRMPLWPLPPIVVVLFTGFALVTQQAQYLAGEAVVVAAALGFWAMWRYRWRRPAEPSVGPAAAAVEP